jgi:hypothetical protein
LINTHLYVFRICPLWETVQRKRRRLNEKGYMFIKKTLRLAWVDINHLAYPFEAKTSWQHHLLLAIDSLALY